MNFNYETEKKCRNAINKVELNEQSEDVWRWLAAFQITEAFAPNQNVQLIVVNESN